jgi:hypothetical protein
VEDYTMLLPSSLCARTSSILRRWLRSSWLDGLPKLTAGVVGGRFEKKDTARRCRTEIVSLRPRLDILEVRNAPNDLLSLLTMGPLLGSCLALPGSLTAPEMAIVRDWGGNWTPDGERSAAAAEAPALHAGVTGLAVAARETPFEASSPGAATASRSSGADASSFERSPTPSGDALQNPLGSDWLRAVDAVFASTAPGRAPLALSGRAGGMVGGTGTAALAFQATEPNALSQFDNGRPGTAAANNPADLAGRGMGASPGSAPTPRSGTTGSAAAGLPGTAGGQSGGAPISLAQAQANLGRIPIAFEPNVGQTAPSVSFLSRGPGFNFFLSGASAVLALPLDGPDASNGRTENVLRLDFVGGNPSAPVEGMGLLPSTSNYLNHHDASASHAAVPNYAAIIARDVYPGIDVEFYGAGSNALEYTFIVHAGADPSAIRMHWEGVNGLSLDRRGNLALNTAGGTLLEEPAFAFQGSAGAGSKAVPVSRTIGGDGDVRFQLGRYDATRDLVIDPTLTFSSVFGEPGPGGPMTVALAVATDSSNSVYVVGLTTSYLFPTTSGVVQSSYGLTQNAFVTEFSSSGTLVYSTYLEGPADVFSSAHGVAVDSSGNAYVCGGEYNTVTGDYAAFLDKLNYNGTALVYSTAVESSTGAGTSVLNGVVLNSSNEAYVVGTELYATFDSPTHWHSEEYIAKVGTTGYLVGSRYVFETLTSTSKLQVSGQIADALAIDSSGSVYVTGSVTGTSIGATSGTIRTSYPSSGGYSAAFAGFVAKYSQDSLTHVWSKDWATYLSGSGYHGLTGDVGRAIELDASGYIYVMGSTSSTDFPTTLGAYQTSYASNSAGNFDVFVSKLDAGATTLIYSTYLGKSSGQTGMYGAGTTGATPGSTMGLDSSGDVYIAVATTCTDFPTSMDALQSSLGGTGAVNTFITRFNSSGTGLLYSTYLGGSAADYATAIAQDSSGDIAIVGYTSSTNYPTAGPYPGSFDGSTWDAFVSKISFS